MSVNDSNSKECCSGFTLIELTVVLLIVGLLIGGFAQAYGLYYKKQQVDITKNNVDTAIEKIAAFQSEYGFLPCPAAVNSPTFMATDCNDPAAAGVQRVATGVSGQILRIGVLPVSYRDPSNPTEVKMLASGDTVIDGWKNRLTYAVIEQSARNAASYANTPTGSIKVNYQDGTPATSTARFVVFSHGQDGVGAYNYNGALRSPCIAGSSVDAANCDGDAVFVANGATEVRSTTGNNNNYDDFIASEGTSLSAQSCADGEELRGINFATKQPVCVPRNLNCPTGQAFVGIRWIGTGNNKRIEAECRLFTTACSPGYVLATVNADGTPTCVRNRTGSCPPGHVQIGTDEATNAPTSISNDDEAFGRERCVPIVSSCAAGQVQVGTTQAANGAIVASCAPRMLNDRCTGRTVLVGYNSNGTPNCVAAPSCPTGQFMTGLVNGVPVCSRALNDMSCPDGKVIKSIINGVPVCDSLVDGGDVLVVRGTGFIEGYAEHDALIAAYRLKCIEQGNTVAYCDDYANTCTARKGAPSTYWSNYVAITDSIACQSWICAAKFPDKAPIIKQKTGICPPYASGNVLCTGTAKVSYNCMSRN